MEKSLQNRFCDCCLWKKDKCSLIDWPATADGCMIWFRLNVCTSSSTTWSLEQGTRKKPVSLNVKFQNLIPGNTNELFWIKEKMPSRLCIRFVLLGIRRQIILTRDDELNYAMQSTFYFTDT